MIPRTGLSLALGMEPFGKPNRWSPAGPASRNSPHADREARALSLLGVRMRLTAETDFDERPQAPHARPHREVNCERGDRLSTGEFANRWAAAQRPSGSETQRL